MNHDLARAPLFLSRRIETGCTLDLAHTHDEFHAYAELDGDIAIRPGDRVQLHGAPVAIRFGETRSERRRATIIQAPLLARLLTSLAAFFLLTELFEVSFSDGDPA